AGCTMLSSGLSPVFLLFTALELSWSLSDEEKKIIVDGHNKYRSQVSPPAMDMLKMSWDTELEAFAQAYAEKCIWDHNKERGRRGENLFAMTPTLDLEFAVEDWNGEEKYYNLTTAMCAPGQMCGHYTQVVWASTHRIGCGVKFCAKIDGIETEDMYLLVCNYYPPGNMKGRKPYKEGASCSQCPDSTLCVNSLCGNFSFLWLFPSNYSFFSLLPAGALDTEELETNSDQTRMEQPTAGAPSTSFGLSLFLLPSVILVGLLL
ncbi:PI16 inhibitor, partial [Dromaius novaehollandiae]|nr:PI16 inhibitor [Dromaius novaehollandiae]